MTPEFPREVRLATLGEGMRTVRIAADPAECAALAERFGLIRVDLLEAEAALALHGAVVTATGQMRAAVVQACVATGEPLHATIEAPFDLRFVPDAELTPDAEIELDESVLDEMPYQGSAIDLGEAVAETLALALDPFPRGPNADDALRAAGVIDAADASPFAALKGLLVKR